MLRHSLRAEPSLAMGFTASALLAVTIALLSSWAQTAVVSGEARATEAIARDLVDAEKLRYAVEQESGNARAFVLTGDESYLPRIAAADEEVMAALERLRSRAATNGTGAPTADEARLATIRVLHQEYRADVWSAVESRKRNAPQTEIALFAGSEARTKRFALDRELSHFVEIADRRLAEARVRDERAVGRATTLNIAITAAALLMAGCVVLLLLRTVRAERARRAETASYLGRIQQSNRDLDAFAGRISHDLRNALNPIGFASARLRIAPGNRESVVAVGHQIDRLVARAAGLIDGLLAFSRAGNRPEAGASCSLGAAVGEVREELAAAAASGRVTLDVAIKECDVACPPGLMHLLIANLAGNAIKFLHDRPVRRVVVHGGPEGDTFVRLSIEDTGPGIPADVIARIFEPFYRVPGTTQPGTGIGLATVRRVVDAYGGRVDVRSVVGQGTTFEVLLPRAAARPAETEIAAAVVEEEFDATASSQG